MEPEHVGEAIRRFRPWSELAARFYGRRAGGWDRHLACLPYLLDGRPALVLRVAADVFGECVHYRESPLVVVATTREDGAVVFVSVRLCEMQPELFAGIAADVVRQHIALMRVGSRTSSFEPRIDKRQLWHVV